MDDKKAIRKFDKHEVKQHKKQKREVEIQSLETVLESWAASHKDISVSKIDTGNLAVKTGKIKYAQKPVLIEGEKRVTLYPTIITNNSQVEQNCSEILKETVSYTKGHTLTTGFTIGASAAFSGSGVTLSGDLSKAKTHTETKTKEISKQYNTKIPGNHSMEVSLEVKETPQVDKFMMNLEIKGKIQIISKEKLFYDEKTFTLREPADSAEKKNSHRKISIPATHLPGIFKQQNLDIKCHPKDKAVIVTLNGIYTTSNYTCDISYGESKMLKNVPAQVNPSAPSQQQPSKDIVAEKQTPQGRTVTHNTAVANVPGSHAYRPLGKEDHHPDRRDDISSFLKAAQPGDTGHFGSALSNANGSYAVVLPADVSESQAQVLARLMMINGQRDNKAPSNLDSTHDKADSTKTGIPSLKP